MLRLRTAVLALAVMISAQPTAALAEDRGEVAKDVVMVLDNSGSMRKNDPKFLLKEAVTKFVNSLDANTRAGMIIYDKTVDLAVPLVAMDEGAKERHLKALEKVNYRGPLTDSAAAIERAIYELKVNGRADVERVILFMTDGIIDVGDPQRDVEMNRWLREDLAGEAELEGIRIFGVAFTEEADYALIQSLARRTRAEYFRALSAEDLIPVFERLRTVILQPLPSRAPVEAPLPEPAVEAPEPPPAEEPVAPPTMEIAPLPAVEEAAPTLLPMEPPAVVPAPPPTTFEPGIPDFAELPAPAVAEPEPGLPWVWILAGSGLVVLGAAVFMMRRRRGPAATAGAETSEYIPEAFLNDTHGNTDRPSYRLGPKPAMLGRVAGQDTDHLDYIVVNQTTVGRRHAMIQYKDYAFWIVDQGSVNGTFVNGERITAERRLKHGDKIRLHNYEFEFLMPEMLDSSKTVFVGAGQSAAAVATASLGAAASAQTPEPEADLEPELEPLPSADAVDFDLTVAPLESAAPVAEPSPGAVDAEGSRLDAEDAGDHTLAPGLVEGYRAPAEPLDSAVQSWDAESPTELKETAVPESEAPTELRPELETGDLSPGEIISAASPVGDMEQSGPGDDATEMFTDEAKKVELSPEPETAGAEDEDLTLDSFIETRSFTASPVRPEAGDDATVVFQEEEPAAPEPASAQAPAEDEDLTLDSFIETRSFTASPVRPEAGDDATVVFQEQEPAAPEPASAQVPAEDEDLTLDSFIETSVFDGKSRPELSKPDSLQSTMQLQESEPLVQSEPTAASSSEAWDSGSLGATGDTADSGDETSDADLAALLEADWDVEPPGEPLPEEESVSSIPTEPPGGGASVAPEVADDDVTQLFDEETAAAAEGFADESDDDVTRMFADEEAEAGSDDEDRTWMPDQVAGAGQKPSASGTPPAADEDKTSYGDTTVFNIDDRPAPGKPRRG